MKAIEEIKIPQEYLTCGYSKTKIPIVERKINMLTSNYNFYNLFKEYVASDDALMLSEKVNNVFEDEIEKMKQECNSVVVPIDWMPIETALPKDNVRVLLYDEVEGIVIGYYDEETEEFYTDECLWILGNVKAWMPMPNAPNFSDGEQYESK